MSRCLFGVFAVVSVVFVAGCGGDGFNRVPVAGTVACEGLENPSGYVVATPASAGAGAPNSSGSVVDGRFAFAEGQGPVAGEYLFEFHFQQSSEVTQSEDGEQETGPTVAYRTKVQIPEGGSESLSVELSQRDRLRDDGGY